MGVFAFLIDMKEELKHRMMYIVLVVVCIYAGALLAYIGFQSAYVDKLESKLQEYYERETIIFNNTKELLDTYREHINQLKQQSDEK